MRVPCGRWLPSLNLLRMRCSALGALGLAGCAAVGPDYEAPTPAAPSGWYRIDPSGRTSISQDAIDLAQWWTRFGDPVLVDVIDHALLASPDLHTAQARLREARARRALARAELFPSVGASGSASASRGSRGITSSQRIELYEAVLDAAWDPDVSGGQRRALEAAQADLEQSAASLAAAAVSLAAEAALDYVDVRAFQARLDAARRNLASQGETLQLTRWRAQAGLASALEVEQAASIYEQTRAQIPVLETGLAEAQHRLAALLAVTPERLDPALLEQRPIPRIEEAVATGIPADTLRRRPDVQAAERRLAAETARIGQAEALRYPAFRLSGSIGLEALSLGALGSGDAVARSLAAGVSGVLFDAGRIRSQVAIQEAVRDQALAAYEAAILTALREVEDALVALANGREREVALAAAVEAARNAALYALQRYSSGLIDFQAVLDTQRTVLTAEDGLARARAESAAAAIRLFEALGAGRPAGASGEPVAGMPQR